MTREEAIKIIDCYDIGFYDLSGEKIPADKLAEAFDMAIEALSKPNYETDTEVRLAVMNRKKEKVILWDAFEVLEYYPIEALSDRPTDEWCTDCKEYDHEKHCCPRFNRVIRTTLNEAVANLKSEFESAVPNCQKCAIKELWKETEKEDLVSVVRCKDCRFWENEHLCLVMSRYGSMDTKAEHYCSYGERREE